MVISTLCLLVGLVLDGMRKSRHEASRLSYMRHPAVRGTYVRDPQHVPSALSVDQAPVVPVPRTA